MRLKTLLAVIFLLVASLSGQSKQDPDRKGKDAFYTFFRELNGISFPVVLEGDEFDLPLPAIRPTITALWVEPLYAESFRFFDDTGRLYGVAQKVYAIVVHHNSQLVVAVNADGSVEFGPGFTADTAAKKFWEIVGKEYLAWQASKCKAEK